MMTLNSDVGVMARLADEGHKVYKLTITNNETRFDQKGIIVNYKSSVAQSAEACNILGVEEVLFKPVDCNHLFYSFARCRNALYS